jgi:hypothetical protein
MSMGSAPLARSTRRWEKTQPPGIDRTHEPFPFPLFNYWQKILLPVKGVVPSTFSRGASASRRDAVFPEELMDSMNRTPIQSHQIWQFLGEKEATASPFLTSQKNQK